MLSERRRHLPEKGNGGCTADMKNNREMKVNANIGPAFGRSIRTGAALLMFAAVLIAAAVFSHTVPAQAASDRGRSRFSSVYTRVIAQLPEDQREAAENALVESTFKDADAEEPDSDEEVPAAEDMTEDSEPADGGEEVQPDTPDESAGEDAKKAPAEAADDDSQKKNGKKYTKKELRLMAATIFAEANSLSFEAKVAVGNVILNRARDTGEWGHVSTVKEVVYDRNWGIVQFASIVGNPSPVDRAEEIYDNLESYKGRWQYDCMVDCIKAARAAFDGVKTVPDHFMYFNSHLQTSREKCLNAGREFVILDKHIYFEF